MTITSFEKKRPQDYDTDQFRTHTYSVEHEAIPDRESIIRLPYIPHVLYHSRSDRNKTDIENPIN